MTQPAEDPSPSSVAPAPEEAAARPGDGAGAKGPTGAESGAERPWGLSFYLFIEPFAVGKVVVDLAAGGGPGPELLRRAGAMEVLSSAGATLPLPFPDAGVDVLICGMGAAAMAEEGGRSALFKEIRRVLRRDGMAVVRVVASALETVAVGVSPRAALADLALEHFSTVDIVEETPFRAVSFFTPGSDELAVSEAMAKVGGRPSHLIALCTSAPERTWQLSESLLVPTALGGGNESAEGELAAWQAEVERLGSKVAETARERDELRERQMVVQDRAERLGRTVSSLRKDVERYLRQISDDATARELLFLERDQLRRKLAAAQQEIVAAQREIDSEKSTVQALRKEVARLRAAHGTGTGRHSP